MTIASSLCLSGLFRRWPVRVRCRNIFHWNFWKWTKKTLKKCQVGKSVAWPSVVIWMCGEKGKTASYDLQYFPCFHTSLNKDILIIGLGCEWRWWSCYKQSQTFKGLFIYYFPTFFSIMNKFLLHLQKPLNLRTFPEKE